MKELFAVPNLLKLRFLQYVVIMGEAIDRRSKLRAVSTLDVGAAHALQ